jgi:GT2 family glycosyltransferase
LNRDESLNISENTDNLPFVSILMVNYNGLAHLKEFFESAFTLNYPRDKYEVVCVDNASKDGSPDWIHENYPQVKLVCLDKNTGFAVGNNIGAKYCRGKFLALINNDTVLDKDWLIELVKQAVREPNAVYGSKMLWYSNHDYIVYGGGKLFAWGDPCHLQTYARDMKDKTEPTFTMYADGCGMLIPQDVFEKIAGFEESYFCYCEDIELSWKTWLAGYKIYFVPTAKFYHKVSATMGGRSPMVIFLMWRNQLRNIIKFIEMPSLAYILPLFTGYTVSLYLAVYCFQEGNYSLILPILKAYLAVMLELPSLIRTKRQIQKNRKVNYRDLRKLGLIFTFRDSIKEALSIFSRKGKFWREVRA